MRSKLQTLRHTSANILLPDLETSRNPPKSIGLSILEYSAMITTFHHFEGQMLPWRFKKNPLKGDKIICLTDQDNEHSEHS